MPDNIIDNEKWLLILNFPKININIYKTYKSSYRAFIKMILYIEKYNLNVKMENELFEIEKCNKITRLIHSYNYKKIINYDKDCCNILKPLNKSDVSMIYFETSDLFAKIENIVIL